MSPMDTHRAMLARMRRAKRQKAHPVQPLTVRKKRKVRIGKR